MVQLIESLLSPDNKIRNEAENTLLDASRRNLSSFLLLNISIIESSSMTPRVRSAAVIMLNKVLAKSKIENDGFRNYLQLPTEQRKELQNKFLILLGSVNSSEISNSLSDIVSDLAGNLLIEKSIPVAERWNNVLTDVTQLYESGSLSIELFLRILTSLFNTAPDQCITEKDKIIPILQKGLSQDNSDIQVKTIKALDSIICNSKIKNIKHFKIFSSMILEKIFYYVNQNDIDSLNSAINQVFSICENEPSFFKPYFKDMVILMAKVREYAVKEEEKNLQIEAIECLILILEKYPKLAKEGNNLNGTLEQIFLNMLQIPEEVPEEWCSPPEGFNDDIEENDDQSDIKIGMDFIDRLISSLGTEVILQPISLAVQNLMADTNDWRKQHASIMALSQVGEYMTDKIDEVRAIVNSMVSLSSNSHPRVRYACLHCLGQYADDLQPVFQNEFYETYFSIAIPLLDDPIPRVVSHSLASLTNFLEHCNQLQIEKYLSTLYTKIIYQLDNGILYVKEACLSTLSALCEGANELFIPLYNQTIDKVFSIMKQANTSNHKQLKGNAIECVTIIAKVFDKEKFAPYLETLITEMVNIQNNDIQNGFDPQRAFILSGWQRVCLLFGKDLTSYMPLIVPGVLKTINELNKFESSEGENIKTDSTEEIDQCIQTISLFLEYVGEAMMPFAEQIFNILISIIEKSPNEDTKLTALDCIPILIKLLKKSNADASSIASNISEKIWKFMETEESTTTLTEFCYTIQKLYKYAGPIFSEEGLLVIYQRCKSHLMKSVERKAKAEEDIDIDEEEAEEGDIEDIIDERKGMEEDFMIEIANILGSLIKSHQEKSLKLFEVIYNELIIPSINSSEVKSKQFGLFLIDDSIEHIGNFLSKDTLKFFLELLLKNSESDELDIRQCSFFGIGIAAQKLGTDAFCPFFEQTVGVLNKMISVERKQDQDQNHFQTAKDNGVSSFGKIIELLGPNIPEEKLIELLKFWISHLPILKDKQESIPQHFLLMKVLEKYSAQIINGNNQIMKHLIHCFSMIYKRNKLSNNEIDTFIVNIIKQLVNKEDTKQLLTNCGLSESEKEFVDKILNN